MKRWMALLVAMALVAGFAIWRLTDHDLQRRTQESFVFESSGQTLSGTLWLPDGDAIAVIALVHGDGPQDRTAKGGYAPIINVLLDRGIAVASWDKPGIGASEGNWLHQSMAQRTAEVRAAIKHLDQRFDAAPIGALGFSQAGWVLPSLTRDDADFIVLVGPAISWRDQGQYYTRIRLANEGLSPQAIEDTITKQGQQDERAFGPDALPGDAPEGLSADRWRFIRENRDADARAALSDLELPLLAVWGSDDLNVDAVRNAAIYQEILAGREMPAQIIIWPNATHGLLKASAYNWQLTDDWSPWAVIRFLTEGRYAFAPGALDAIADWIEGIG